MSPSPAATGLAPLGRAARRPVAASLVTLAVAFALLLVAARISPVLFIMAGAAIIVVLAALSYLAPRAMLIGLVFTPILDRYLVALLVPEAFHGVTTYVSEALLVMVTLSIGLRAAREGRLWPALRHPVVAFLAAFAVVGAISAVVNGVPPVIAVAGIAFTMDAAVLFVLPRMIGFDLRHARLAVITFTAVATVAAFLALGQVLLHADFLGMETFSGRFSEGRRVAAIFVSPNMLGVILAMAIPLPLMASVRPGDRRRRLLAAAVTFVLTLALLYTFSRGAWLGVAVGAIAIGAMLDWRALVALMLFAVLAYGAALVLPRHVLEPDPGDIGFDLGAATVGRLDPIASGTDLRVRFVHNAAPIVADHPVVGAGPGRYGGAVAWRFGTPLSHEYRSGTVPRNRTVDNFWLHVAVEFGVLGVLLLASAIAIAIRQAIGRARAGEGWIRLAAGSAAAIAIIVAVDSLAEMLLEGNTTAFAVWFFLGVASVLAAPSPASTPRDR